MSKEQAETWIAEIEDAVLVSVQGGAAKKAAAPKKSAPRASSSRARSAPRKTSSPGGGGSSAKRSSNTGSRNTSKSRVASMSRPQTPARSKVNLAGRPGPAAPAQTKKVSDRGVAGNPKAGAQTRGPAKAATGTKPGSKYNLPLMPGDKNKPNTLTPNGKDGKISGRDIKQGALNDCWVQSPMAALADKNGGKPIQNLVKPNKNGSYTVNLYDRNKKGNLVKSPVTVAGKFPVMPNGKPRGNQSDAAWPQAVERAFAVKQGGYNGRLREGSSMAQGGSPKTSMEMMTGKPARIHAPKDLSAKRVNTDLKQGIATIATQPNTADKRLHPYHVYQVKSADPKNKTVTIHNPWGTEKDVTLKESELRNNKNFSGYTEADL
jgi:hypothetical protein